MQLSTMISAILAAAVSVNAAYPPTRVQAERLGLLEERVRDEVQVVGLATNTDNALAK